MSAHDRAATVVLAGPSLPPDAAAGWTVLPPAAHGDVARVVLDGATCVVLLDGFFEHVRAVWHKELLWALARGCRLIGASSMGALRAAECADFGMEPVGRIAEDYRSGRRTSDGDVAMAHLGPEDGWRAISVALVDVDATLESAAAAGALASELQGALAHAARSVFYADRTFPAVVNRAVELGHLPRRRRADTLEMLTAHRVDQKRLDALAALRHVHEPPPPSPPFAPAATASWRRALALLERGSL